jgi:hypothetical protein
VTLPSYLGGWTYEVVLEGGYTFTPVASAVKTTLALANWGQI